MCTLLLRFPPPKACPLKLVSHFCDGALVYHRERMAGPQRLATGGDACRCVHRFVLTSARFLLTFSKLEADWPPTARFDEHRLSKDTIDLVCASGEQERPTASTRWLFTNFPKSVQ
jgi:hypothetical protein